MTAAAVLGVDPGTKGGLVLVRANGTLANAWALKPGMPEDDIDRVIEFAAHSLLALGSNVCFFELVGYIGAHDGKQGDGGQGAFTFGHVDGYLRGGLRAHGIRPRYVPPQMWQGAMNCMSGGNKNVTKRRAIELWPAEKWTHALSDAALIAEFGRRRTAGL